MKIKALDYAYAKVRCKEWEGVVVLYYPMPDCDCDKVLDLIGRTLMSLYLKRICKYTRIKYLYFFRGSCTSTLQLLYCLSSIKPLPYKRVAAIVLSHDSKLGNRKLQYQRIS